MEPDTVNTITEVVANAVLYGAAIIGGASLILQGIAKIAKITPSTRDDEIVSKVQGVLLSLQRILDRVALNPSKEDAREAERK